MMVLGTIFERRDMEKLIVEAKASAEEYSARQREVIKQARAIVAWGVEEDKKPIRNINITFTMNL